MKVYIWVFLLVLISMCKASDNSSTIPCLLEQSLDESISCNNQQDKIGWKLVREVFAIQRARGLSDAIDALYIMLEDRKQHFTALEGNVYQSLCRDKEHYDALVKEEKKDDARQQEIEISDTFFPFLIAYEMRTNNL